MKQVWVISELYYPEESATGHYMTMIAEEWAKTHRVNVLCAQPNYLSRGRRAPAREVHKGVNIFRVPSTTLRKDVFPLRLINILTVTASMFFAMLFGIKKGDCVFVVTNPPSLPFSALAACKLKGAKLLLRIDDVYPDVLLAAGTMGKKGLAIGLLNLVTSRLYRLSDTIVVLGRDMQALVKEKMKGDENNGRLRIITNWADTDQVAPAPRNKNALLKELGLVEKFIVQIAGNMGRVQGIECLLEAARLLEDHKDIHFLFIGSGAKREWLKSEIGRYGLENINVLPNRPRSDQVNFLNACDIAVSSLISGMRGVSVPSRAYNIFAAGKPLLAIMDENSEIALTVKEENLGWVAPPDDPTKIAEAILEAKRSPSLLKAMSENSRRAAENKFSYQKVLSAYRRIVDEING